MVVSATFADGTVVGVRDLELGTDQGGSDGEGIEVVISWSPWAEAVTSPTKR